MTPAEYQEWLETDRCKRAGCAAQAVDGSAFCAPHGEDEKRYERNRTERRKQAHPTWCSGCNYKRPRQGKSKYCPTCLARFAGKFARGRTPGFTPGSTSKTRIKDADGRLRYHGQGKRGRRPRSDDEFYALKEARREMEAFERGLLFEQSAEFASWTQQQRKTFRAENLAHKARAVRWLRGPDIATTDPEDDTAEDET